MISKSHLLPILKSMYKAEAANCPPSSFGNGFPSLAEHTATSNKICISQSLLQVDLVCDWVLANWIGGEEINATSDYSLKKGLFPSFPWVLEYRAHWGWGSCFGPWGGSLALTMGKQQKACMCIVMKCRGATWALVTSPDLRVLGPLVPMCTHPVDQLFHPYPEPWTPLLLGGPPSGDGYRLPVQRGSGR